MTSKPTGGGVSAAVGDARHQNHLRLEGPDSEVRVRDRALPGDQRPGVVPKVPAEADVSSAQVLAGVMQVDAERDGSVLDEVGVVLVDVVHLGQRYGERNLV